MAEPKKPSPTFTNEEMEQINDMMDTPQSRVACPRCDDTLVLAGPIAGVGTTRRYFEVACRRCGLNAIVADDPSRRRRSR